MYFTSVQQSYYILWRSSRLTICIVAGEGVFSICLPHNFPSRIDVYVDLPKTIFHEGARNFIVKSSVTNAYPLHIQSKEKFT